MSNDLIQGFRFEVGALAFYRENDKLYPCQILEREEYYTSPNKYLVRGSGRFWVEETVLLSGFEEDFPGLDQVVWGYFTSDPEFDVEDSEESYDPELEAWEEYLNKHLPEYYGVES